MAVIATTTPMLSGVLMTDSSQLSQDFNYVYANAKEAAAADVKLGQVVLWNGTDAFRILKNADFSNDTTLTATAGAGFPDDKSRLAVVVGFDAVGSDYVKSVGTTAVKVALLFRGQASLKKTGLVFDAGVVAARQATAIKILEGQLLDVKDVAAAATATFYNV